MLETNEIVENVKAEFARQMEEVNPAEKTEKDKEETVIDDENSDDKSGTEGEASLEDSADDDVVDDDNGPSAELKARAEAVGIDLDTLGALGDKADLFITRMELAEKGDANNDAGAEVKEEDEAGDVEEPVIKLPTEDQLIEGGLDEDIAKGLAEGMAKMVELIQGQSKKLNELSSSREAEQLEAQAIREIEDFENRVSGLGDAYESKFGKGGIGDIKPGSTEYKAREELYETMQDLKDIAAKRGQKLSQKDAFERALKFVASDINDGKKFASVKKKAAERQKQLMNQPHGVKDGGKGDPEKAAVDAVQAILNQNS